MRPVGALSKILSLAVALAAFVSAATLQAAPQKNTAVVRAVRGTANYSTDAGANWKKLSVGNKLEQNSVIRTAPGSTVDLFLGVNGPVVRVTEATTMGIDKLTMDAAGAGETVIETQLDLRNGRILGNVKKMAAASKYEVKTPQGVAGIRGTRYDIRADGTVTVIEGTVIVVYVVGGQASTATVNAGQTATPPAQGGGVPPVVNTDAGVGNAISGEIDAATTISIDDGRTEPTTVVIVIEPKEAFQDGDPAKLETEVKGSSGNSTPSPGE